MTHYWFHLMNERGVSAECVNVWLDTDSRALELAFALSKGSHIEVWRAQQMLYSLNRRGEYWDILFRFAGPEEGYIFPNIHSRRYH